LWEVDETSRDTDWLEPNLQRGDGQRPGILQEIASVANAEYKPGLRRESEIECGGDLGTRESAYRGQHKTIPARVGIVRSTAANEEGSESNGCEWPEVSGGKLPRKADEVPGVRRPCSRLHNPRAFRGQRARLAQRRNGLDCRECQRSENDI